MMNLKKIKKIIKKAGLNDDLNPKNWHTWEKPVLKDFDVSNNGQPLIFEKNALLRPHSVEIDLEPVYLLELLRCKVSVHYFTYNYVQVLGDSGYIYFTLNGREYQRKILDVVAVQSRVIAMMPRQSGKTVAIASYIAWKVTFHPHIRALLCTHKLKVAKDHLNNKIKPILERLPKWMQQGCESWGKETVELENGSSIIIDTTTGTSGAGLSIDLLYLDEFALVESHVAKEFMASILPVVSGKAKSQVIITSTPRGMNHFYTLYKSKNAFVSFGPDQEKEQYSMSWRDVPRKSILLTCSYVNQRDPDDVIKREFRVSKKEEPPDHITTNNKKYEIDRSRDRVKEDILTPEEFKEMERPTIGDIKWFQEYECSFMGSSNTLISSDFLPTLEVEEPIKKIDMLKIYEDPKPRHKYIAGVDVSEGVNEDYTVCSVIDVTRRPYKVVAVMRDNATYFNAIGEILSNIGFMYNNALMIIENNGIGASVADDLWDDFDYENIFRWTEEKRSRSRKMGIRTTSRTKLLGCKSLKELIETGNLSIVDHDIISELFIFVGDGKKYAAEEGEYNYDDCVMSLVMASFFMKQKEFQNYISSSSNFARDILKSDINRVQEEINAAFGYQERYCIASPVDVDYNRIIENTILSNDDSWLWGM